MIVIDNGGMDSIKKQIFLAVGLFFSCSNLGAMCPQTVGPVLPGEAIWKVTSRIGIATNVIESQLCTLASNCVQFGQSDIGVGGVYTISTPGVYCMKEDANWTVGAAITVASSDVTIDMQDHTLAGAFTGATGIVLNGGISNVTIKNGNIKNPSVACISNGGPAVLLQNIIIQSMNFNVVGGTSFPAVAITGATTANQFYNVLIEDCTGYNSFINLNPGLSAVVRGCVFTCGQSIGNSSITLSGGTGAAAFGQSFVIEDCISKNVLLLAGPASNALFTIQSAWSAVIRNCVSYGSGTGGFFVNLVGNAVVSNCAALNASGGNGFTFQDPIQLSGGALAVIDCVAEECTNGFWLKNLTISGFGWEGATLTRCIASNNTVNGIYATNIRIGSTISISCMDCDASGNGGTGFQFGIAPGVDPVGAIIGGALLRCNAANNVVDGFFFSTNIFLMNISLCSSVTNGNHGYNIACTNCYFETNATGNTGFGFFSDPASGGNTFVGNRAQGNSAGNYGGLLVVPNVVAYPLFVGVSYLNNVSA